MGFKAVVLAAGKGTRFKSTLPKVLHKILGKPLLWYVLRAVEASGCREIVVVVGHGREQVEAFLSKEFPRVKTVFQEEQLGTGHAVMVAEKLLKDYKGKLLVINGDTPLIDPEDLKSLVSLESDMVLLTADAPNPSGYGRVLRDGNEVLRIVEEKDALSEERKIREINAGVYAFDAAKLFEALKEIDNRNAQKEYYLPDVLKVFKKKGWSVKAVKAKEFASVMGVNNRHELSAAEREVQRKIIKQLQLNGVTVHNPDSAFIEPDVQVGEDTEIFAPVYIRGKTKIGNGCYIGAFSLIKDSILEDNVIVESHSWLDGAHLEEGSSVGPFAKLRPGTRLESGARVGTFVETKNAHLESGVKANHLSYLGDCRIGEGTNVGAGTITCNYDGFNKWRTEIGKNVFIGSNTLFIAPVKVGDKAITAAGSVITGDVPENALAVARAKQVNYLDKAEVIKERARRKKGNDNS